jgi:antitoxin VapB
MALSIRNPEVERLARDLSRRTGESVTESIRAALADRMDALAAQTAGRLAEIQAISRACTAAPDLDSRSFEEILGYDGAGTFGHGG